MTETLLCRVLNVPYLMTLLLNMLKITNRYYGEKRLSGKTLCSTSVNSPYKVVGYKTQSLFPKIIKEIS